MYDPHFWLDPNNVIKQTEIIGEKIVHIDTPNTQYYLENITSFQEQLLKLDQKYKNELASCTTRTIITSHNAFEYLAHQYNLEIISISGLSPEQEPSPKKMIEVIEKVKEKNIQYIFFETLVSPKLSETIASEVGAKTLVLNPIEGLSEEEISNGKNYIKVMEENLKNLKTALTCQ